MRTRSLIASVLLLSSLQAQVSVDWIEAGGLALALDQDDNVYTVNYDSNLGGDITLTKRDAQGNLIWDAQYDQASTTRFDRATWVAADPQGNAFVSGTVMSGFSNPVNANSLLMKFDPDGTLLWREEYGSDFDGSSTRKCLVDLVGNAYVLGIGTGPNGQVTTVRKFDPQGATLWAWYDQGVGAPINIKFTPDSALVIAHRSVTGNINGYTRLDRDGNTVWSIGSVGSTTVGDLAGDALGNTYLVHTSVQSGSITVLRKVSPTGSTIWENTYSITAFRVEVGTDHAPVLCGFPPSGSGGAAFLKTDADGALLWSNANADGPNNFLLHAQLMMDQDNNAYLCAGVLFAMGICKVEADGMSAWSITAGTGASQAFALGNDQAVYVTGGSTLRLGQDMSTTTEEVSAWNDPEVIAFPQPATDQLWVDWQGHRIAWWHVRTISGALLAQGAWNGPHLDVDHFPPGLFFLDLVDINGLSAMVRVLKE